MEYFKYFLLFCVISYANSQGTCPQDWTKWEDEKCFLLISSFATYTDASQACAGKGGILANVKEEEQQLFLSDFIFNVSAIEIGVWIGATRVSETDFQWGDGTPLIPGNYSNWTPGSPTSTDGRNCVAMQSRLSKLNDIEGTWKDVSCASPNFYVCETVPIWTPDEMQLVLIETRRKLELATERLDSHLANPVPIGFIYTQLPGHPLPSELWPVVGWEEVTAQFAGKFFRAFGGASAEFGATQNADSPRLVSVRPTTIGGKWTDPINIEAGRWSGNCISGDEGWTGDNIALNFLVSNPENRPVNTAVRIWKRLS